MPEERQAGQPGDDGAQPESDARRADSLRSLIDAMAHALRTPLGTISNSAGLLRMSGNDPATVATVADILERAARAATDMVADMEELARLEGGIDLDLAPIDGETLARRVIVDARPSAAQRDVEIALAAHSGPALFAGDESMLRQALSRLVLHAAEKAEPGTRISVFVEVTDSAACFIVEDHGPPIPPEQMPWLFHGDGRRAPSRRRGGLGLGLAIAGEIARNHGGSVRCDPSERCTALFRLSVPTGPPS